MKVITIFNEKGGSGKTTLTALCASYFAYQLNLPVWCVDFDNPSYQLLNIRSNDEFIIRNNALSAIARASVGNRPYPISPIAPPLMITPDYLKELGESMRKRIASKDGYLFLDFPGSLSNTDPAFYLITRGFVDLVVIPVDSDRQAIKAALGTIARLSEHYVGSGRISDRLLVLWNREAGKERQEVRQGGRDWYRDGAEAFRRMGVPTASNRVHEILIARRDGDTPGFIRNTLCWPKNNIKRACPYLPAIFDELLARVDGTWSGDYTSTNDDEM